MGMSRAIQLCILYFGAAIVGKLMYSEHRDKKFLA